jgi:predicted small secreted protein
MKIVLLIMLLSLVACNTASGVLSGAGKDLQAAGSWMSPKESVPLK